MPYNIADPGRDIDDLVVREAHVFRAKQGIDLRTEHRVEAIDPTARRVRGKTQGGEVFQLPYEKLLIATGAYPILPDLPGFDLPGVMALKTLQDGRRIKRFIHEQNPNKAIIIGMGYIALEMCEALHDRNIGVEMVKPRPVLLPWMHEKLAHMVREEIEANGINMHLGHEVKKIEKKDRGLRVICSDVELEGQMVLGAIGIKPNSQLAEEAGLELGPKKAIAVDRSLLTSDQDIYAAGDCADAFHVVTDQRTWIPLALRANRAGWAVADNVMGKKAELQGVAGTAAFKVLGLEVARTGLSLVEAEKSGFEPVEMVIQSSTRAHRHPGASMIGVQMVADRKSGRLLGAQLVGRDGAAHRINAAAVALHARFTVEEFSQSDLAYAPPFGPTWDPLLTAANQLLKII
jgi:NADPH-dependent 2,4-dienoyl-CoA reductase/sulfur reductase-like enzyme